MDTVSELGTVFASFLICQVLFHFVSSWFSAKVSCFNDLSLEKKIDWNSRVVSTCHSLVVGVFSLYIFFFDEAAIADPLWGDSLLGNVNIAITTGYLISDLLLLILYWRAIGDIVYAVHHCTVLYACCLVLKEGILAYIGNFRLIAELSTPFVNQLWFFKTLKYSKSSKAYIINGVLMTVMFFIVRIAVIPNFYYLIYRVYATKAYIRIGLLTQYSWVGSCIVLDVMNVIWMIKMTMGWVHLSQLLILQEKATRSPPHNREFD
ncbi:transmembrane protein 56-like isoform X1 [Trichechus manatus latirostris]|uniref:Transmembrane protein 56-like isoform X1 n=1 Tax=Trichechus manatus latirostris TaxID=127582 RepID=A0A2Y9DRF0_TRIMA|nr:transmembrane protein 56-like isoform X1 [Trichechus manatus latirostris]